MNIDFKHCDTDTDHKPDTWLQIFQAKSRGRDFIADGKQKKELWKRDYEQIFLHSFNPHTLQFESSISASKSGYSGFAQCARGANSLELARMFGKIPSNLCFRDSHVTLDELHAASESLHQHITENLFFVDTVYNDKESANQSDRRKLIHTTGSVEFMHTLKIPKSSAGCHLSRPDTGICFQSSNLELMLSNNKSLSLPPLCSKGASNWMHTIVQAEQTRKRVAQLIGYQNKLSLLVRDRWFKLIKLAIFIEKSFERQWKVMEKHFDPNEHFCESSKWKARCTLGYLQDHIYTLLRELVYLMERVSYKNIFSNSEASTADILFKSLEKDLSLIPYPIKPLTEQEEGKELYKLCKEALQSGCSPFRRFISPRWVEAGNILFLVKCASCP